MKYLIENKGLDINFQDKDFKRTSLHRACGFGQFQIVKYLVLKGADVSIKQNQGATCFQIACQEGKLDVVRFLVENSEAKSQINQTDNEGNTALLLAAKKNQLSTMKYLISKGANFEVSNFEGRNAVWFGCCFGHFDMIQYLISLGCDDEQPDSSGTTPLQLLIQENYFDILKFIIENGAYSRKLQNNNSHNNNVYEFDDEEEEEGHNEKIALLQFAVQENRLEILKYLISIKFVSHWNFETGQSLVWIACEHEHFEIVEYLVGHLKFDFETENSFKQSPLLLIVEKGNFKILKYLLQQKHISEKGKSTFQYPTRPLLKAIEKSNFPMVKFFVEKLGIDFSQEDKFLFAASTTGNLDILKYLIDVVGCDIRKTNGFGQTSLLESCRLGQLKIVKYFVEDFGLRSGYELDFHRNSAIYYCAANNQLELLKYLVSLGFDFVSRNLSGESPFDVSCSSGNLEIVKYFISIGCEISQNVVKIVVDHGHLELLKFFVSIGVKIDSLNASNGLGLLHIAASAGNLEMLKFFVSIGFSLNEKNETNETLLFVAARSSQLGIMKYLIESNVSNQQKEEPSSAGITPIIIATIARNLEGVKLLVFQIGCNINARDKQGKTAFFHACSIGYLDLVKFLISAGCDQSLRTEHHTPLQIAKVRGNFSVANYLESKLEVQKEQEERKVKKRKQTKNFE